MRSGGSWRPPTLTRYGRRDKCRLPDGCCMAAATVQLHSGLDEAMLADEVLLGTWI